MRHPSWSTAVSALAGVAAFAVGFVLLPDVHVAGINVVTLLAAILAPAFAAVIWLREGLSPRVAASWTIPLTCAWVIAELFLPNPVRAVLRLIAFGIVVLMLVSHDLPARWVAFVTKR